LVKGGRPTSVVVEFLSGTRRDRVIGTARGRDELRGGGKQGV